MNESDEDVIAIKYELFDSHAKQIETSDDVASTNRFTKIKNRSRRFRWSYGYKKSMEWI